MATKAGQELAKAVLQYIPDEDSGHFDGYMSLVNLAKEVVEQADTTRELLSFMRPILAKFASLNVVIDWPGDTWRCCACNARAKFRPDLKHASDCAWKAAKDYTEAKF